MGRFHVFTYKHNQHLVMFEQSWKSMRVEKERVHDKEKTKRSDIPGISKSQGTGRRRRGGEQSPEEKFLEEDKDKRD